MKKFILSILTIGAFASSFAQNEMASAQTLEASRKPTLSVSTSSNPTTKKPKKVRKVAVFHYEIINNEGLTVMQKNLSFSPSEYDFSSLPEGSYIIKVYYHNSLMTTQKYLLK